MNNSSIQIAILSGNLDMPIGINMANILKIKELVR